MTTTPRARRLPLEGIRIADITVVWAGPHVTQLLAEWGADVVRVEPVNRIQPYSRGGERIMTRDQALRTAQTGVLMGAYPEFEPGEDPWNRNPSFNSHARGKRSMTCDIMSPEGREAFLRLIEHSDVFIENNVPETIEKARITYDDLREVNPRIIVLRMPAYGLNGPYKNYRGFGTHVEGMIGHHYLRSYPDMTPEATGEAFTADAMAGVMGALAVVMALRHRHRTGQGQQIEMPLAEAFLPVLGEWILDFTMNGRVAGPQGNRHRWRAPHGVYPCRPATVGSEHDGATVGSENKGEDQWIAIDVGSDAEFAALCRVLGAESLLEDERFRSALARWRHTDDLDRALAEHTRDRDKGELFHELQRAGVTAAPVNDELEAHADPHLAARGWFQEIEMPGVGRHAYPGLLFSMLNTPNRLTTPPPRLGEHNEEIYLGLLGYSREEYDALVAKGLVGDTYPPHLVPRRD